MTAPRTNDLRVWYDPDHLDKDSDISVVPAQNMTDVVLLFEGFEEFSEYLLRQGRRDRSTWGAERFEPDGFGDHAWYEIDTHEINEARAFLDSLAA